MLAVNRVSLHIHDGEFLVLVGPSGCGKSTLLRMIAGLEEVTDGTIRIGNRDVTDLAPRDRDIAMVFQDYALYSHMDVRANLSFGLKLRRLPKDEIRTRVDEVARILGLEDLLDRKPRELSGGQRQRVAMGRAIVREPRVYLMDEPLSNLDAKLRVTMRAELARLHKTLGVTTLYVTHDQVEAMTLGQRVAVLRHGEVQQCDIPQRLFDHPANVFVASFLGSPAMNLVECVIDHDVVRFGQHAIPVSHESKLAELEGRYILGIRPTDFELARAGSRGDLPQLRVRVDLVEQLGSESLIFFNVDAQGVSEESLSLSDAETDDSNPPVTAASTTVFTARILGRQEMLSGSTVDLVIDDRHLHVFEFGGSGKAVGIPVAAAGDSHRPRDRHVRVDPYQAEAQGD